MPYHMRESLSDKTKFSPITSVHNIRTYAHYVLSAIHTYNTIQEYERECYIETIDKR